MGQQRANPLNAIMQMMNGGGGMMMEDGMDLTSVRVEKCRALTAYHRTETVNHHGTIQRVEKKEVTFEERKAQMYGLSRVPLGRHVAASKAKGMNEQDQRVFVLSQFPAGALV